MQCHGTRQQFTNFMPSLPQPASVGFQRYLQEAERFKWNLPLCNMANWHLTKIPPSILIRLLRVHFYPNYVNYTFQIYYQFVKTTNNFVGRFLGQNRHNTFTGTVLRSTRWTDRPRHQCTTQWMLTTSSIPHFHHIYNPDDHVYSDQTCCPLRSPKAQMLLTYYHSEAGRHILNYLRWLCHKVWFRGLRNQRPHSHNCKHFCVWVLVEK